jgi:predicted nucleic acid-binding protein
VAAARGLILVTANVTDFQHFAGLTVVDWGL